MKRLINQIIFMLIIIAVTAIHASGIEIGDGQLHGFVSQGYLNSSGNNFPAHDSSDGTFRFTEIGINYTHRLMPGLFAGAQVYADQLGNVGDLEPRLDWALVDYQWKEWLGFKAGRLKMPVGLYNDIRDLDMLRPWVWLPQSVYTHYFRDPSLSVDGGGIYGTVLAGSAGNFSYQFQFGNQRIATDGALTRYVEGTTPFGLKIDDFEANNRWVTQLEWETPLTGLVIGSACSGVDLEVSGHYTADVIMPISMGPGPPVMTTVVNQGDSYRQIYDTWRQSMIYFKYGWRNFDFSAEYMTMTSEYTVFTFSSVGPGSIIPMKQEFDSEGYYASAAYRFNRWFQLSGYYSEGYPNADDKKGERSNPDYKAWLKDTCLTMRFDFAAYWIFKLEGHLFDGAAYVNPADNPDGYDRHWNLLAAKVTFVF